MFGGSSFSPTFWRFTSTKVPSFSGKNLPFSFRQISRVTNFWGSKFPDNITHRNTTDFETFVAGLLGLMSGSLGSFGGEKSQWLMSSQGRLPYDRYKWSLLLLLLITSSCSRSSSTSRNRCHKKTTVSLQPYFRRGGGRVGQLKIGLGTPLRHETRYLAKYAEMSQGAVSTGSTRPRWDTRALKNIPPMDVLCNIGNQPKISKDQFMWGKTWGILIPQNPLPPQKNTTYRQSADPKDRLPSQKVLRTSSPPSHRLGIF